MTEFLDYIKNSLSVANNVLTTGTIIICMSLAVIVGAVIYFTYRFFHKGVIYSHNFNATLPLITVISTMIILSVSSNLAFSLGALGALSMIRFRTAVKDPIDLMFLFWSVAAGIALGAKLYYMMLYGNIIVAVAIILFTRFKVNDKTYLLVISCENAAFEAVDKLLSGYKKTLRSKIASNGMIEMTIELKIKSAGSTIAEDCAAIDGVASASLVSYNGDYSV